MYDVPGQALAVSGEEAGQKLLQFLARRLDAPAPMLHRWIRTGQVRINGRRCAPFARLEAGDGVRVPPFARPRSLPDAPRSGWRPDILAESGAVLICCKPAGLPVHAGSGHTDSLIARLRALRPEAPFALTPAHRLDKAASGLLIVGKSYEGLRLAQAAAGSGDIGKVYLAWAHGLCPWEEETLLVDRLLKARDADGRERVRVSPDGRPARLRARCLERRQDASLLRLVLHTGRNHQIRAQMAARGFALVGDPKYGGPPCRQGLLLHAAALVFAPALAEALGLPSPRLVCPAPWRDEWSAGRTALFCGPEKNSGAKGLTENSGKG
jgi:23S rRNA pseudouridine955/2504/2580 synthase